MEITKPLILEQVVRDGKFLKICQKITHNNELYKDLFQECILILLEQPEQKIVELHSKDELKPFFIRIVQNNYNSKTSPFFKKYKSKVEFKKDEGEQTESSYDYDKLVEYINSGGSTRVEWFDTQIVKLLVSEKNIYKLEKKTGINRASLRNAISRFKDRINGSEEFKRRSV